MRPPSRPRTPDSGSVSSSLPSPPPSAAKMPRPGLPLPRPLTPPPAAASWMSISAASLASMPASSDGGRGGRGGAGFPAQPATPRALLRARARGGTVELRLAARHLLNKDTLSLSDPFAVLYADHFGVGVERIGQTETVYDDLSPAFVTRFVFTPRNSRFGTVLVELYDRDDPDEDAPLARHDFLGRAEVDVNDLLDEPGGRINLNLLRAEGATRGRTDRGSVSVFAEVLRDAAASRGVARRPARAGGPLRPGVVVFRVNCAALRRKGVPVGKRAVVQFFEIQRKRPEAGGGLSWTTVHRSEDGRRVNAEGYVEFKSASLDELALHNGQPERELRLVFYKRNVRTEHDLVCYAALSLADVVSSPPRAHRGRAGAHAAVPLVGNYADYEGMGAMQITGLTRDPRRDDVLVLDLSVDIFMPRGYTSALNDTHVRRRVRGKAGRPHRLFSGRRSTLSPPRLAA